MKLSKSFFNLTYTILGILLLVFSCTKEEEKGPLKSKTYEYEFHNGQTVSTAPYLGIHLSNLSASIKLVELENGNTNITVTIKNSMNGQTYHTHAHDAADPSSTPNGTPYNESPNSDIFAQAIQGNGGEVSVTQEAKVPYNELISSYEGFFVVHDPLQEISTTNISSYLVVGSFARSQTPTNYKSSTFNYSFNEGQISPDFAYSGTHEKSLAATIFVQELAGNQSRITVHLSNTMDGETYHTHAHDAADSTTTPNGTPYIESPNSEVFAAPIESSGNSGTQARISSKSYDEITTSYQGFFVVHDPLQTISTTDPSTFVILGSFAR